jgi:hypothetical protein
MALPPILQTLTAERVNQLTPGFYNVVFWWYDKGYSHTKVVKNVFHLICYVLEMGKI